MQPASILDLVVYIYMHSNRHDLSSHAVSVHVFQAACKPTCVPQKRARGRGWFIYSLRVTAWRSMLLSGSVSGSAIKEGQEKVAVVEFLGSLRCQEVPDNCELFCKSILSNFALEIYIQGKPNSLSSVRRHYYVQDIWIAHIFELLCVIFVL